MVRKFKQSKLTQKYLNLFLVFVLLVAGFVPSHMNIFSYAEVSNLLLNKTVTLKQDGVTIPENGSLNFEKNINLKFEFQVPVKGDVAEGDTNYIHQNDTATFLIAEGFTLTSPPTYTLSYDSKKVGTLTITNEPGNRLVANILFDGDTAVFDGSYNSVNCYFEASLLYNGASAGASDQDISITVLEKTYTVHIPALPITVSGQKQGAKNGETIDWNVKLEATQGGNQVDLGGYTFSDDLGTVGSLKRTFKMGTSSDVLSAVEMTPQPVLNGSTYTYEIPQSTTGPIYIFYTTNIAQDFVTNGTRTITNTGKLFKESALISTFSKSISFQNQWIEKAAAETTVVDEGGKKVGYITWRIIANHMEATLPNAIITDVLDSKLEFVSAKWTTWDSGTSQWNAAWTDILTRPVDDEYALSTESIGGIPNLTKNVMLEIKTKVKEEHNVGHQVQSISNRAYISWDGQGNIGSSNVAVNIGMYPITKSGGAYDPTTHKIPWTVQVLASDQNADLRVMDLLVYGTSFNAATATIVGNAANGLLQVTAGDLANLTPAYRQKYDATSFVGSGLKPTVYTIENASGVAIADLLVVTESNDNGIDVSGGTRTFTFNSVVTDPAVYAANTTSGSRININNTATLFSANEKLNARQATVATNSEMMLKEALTVSDAADPHANRNKASANASNSFNYVDKSVVFRLLINKNDLSNLTNDLTMDSTQTFGKVTVTDQLPTGWEFVEIVPGKNFLMYQGDRSGAGVITAQETDLSSTLPNFTSDFTVDGTATFTFDQISDPYVILVKARPTAVTLLTYFNSNKTTNISNILKLKGENWTGTSTTKSVAVVSEVIGKNYQASSPADGILSWTVDYKPYLLNLANQATPLLRIEDTLPQGMELLSDAKGNLDLTGDHFAVHEMSLQSDGTYTLGDAVPLTLGENLLYDSNTRVLTFNIPENSPEKGYRLTYKTEIVANANVTLNNTVKLIGSNISEVNNNKNYSVSSSDAGATMVRSGWVEITKLGSGTPLAGAKFAIFTSDRSKIFRSGTTDASGKLTLRGLPVGDYILKETAAPAGYELMNREYAVHVEKVGGVTTTSIDGVVNNKISIINHLSNTTGHLKISKNVTGNDGDLTKSFDFSLRANGVVGTYMYEKTLANGVIVYGDVTFSSELALFSLKNGESIKVMNLPTNTNFIVTESYVDFGGYTTTLSGDCAETTGNVATGTIAVSATQNVNYNNHKDIFSDLKITKKVAGNAGDTNKLFSFKVQIANASPLTDTYVYTGIGGKEDGSIHLVNNEAIITLKHGQGVLIKDLPKGVNYTVTELIDSTDIYDIKVDGTVSDHANGTISGNGLLAHEFVNSKSSYGNLRVEKQVLGVGGELDREFEFTLKISPLEDSERDYVIRDAQNVSVQSGKMTFNGSGEATFKLIHGQSITVEHLPNNSTYEVIEKNYVDYDTHVDGLSTGKILGMSTPSVVFENTNNTHGKLHVEKLVSGVGDTDKAFRFKLVISPALTGTYPVQMTTNKATHVANIVFTNGKAEFELKHTDVFEMELPKGTTYELSEVDYGFEGYQMNVVGDLKGTIPLNSTVFVKVINHKPYVKPEPTPVPNPTPVPEPTPIPTEPTTVPQPTTEVVTTEPSTETTTEKKEVNEKTLEDQPKEGKIPVKEGEKPTVTKPPTNGTIDLDDRGNWTYTPNKGFKGEDSFVITVQDEDGNEEEIFIDIDVEEIPLDAGNGGFLPKTGQIAASFFYLVGITLIVVGIVIRRKKGKQLD